MKKLLAIAALLLASTAAHAQYTFEYGGRTIRIDPDRGTVSIPGVYDNTGHKSKRAKSEEGTRKQKSNQEAKTDSQSAPAPAPGPAAPPAAATSTEATTAAVAPSNGAGMPQTSPPSPPAPQSQQTAVPASPPSPPPQAPAPTVATAAPAPVAKPVTPAAAAQANSPIGMWLTEEKEGQVRIEQCGTNLCGYAVDKTSNQNGEQVLINMKPGKDKWSGRILDPNTGSTYDSTIALKGSDTLRVQGCAFGGMFCGGQTWTRVN
ncbi:DUF2147 domain-containing protein [Bradyrhizobium cenepequi]|uniref:DUF2147 domain-containing protein n=1 Tax=Bradyrhizobium cenepequi TaxID=2821403 RepID=UPI001CE35F71|nr:DUF2147 domain-containing protein [Bradyrhizobium cenepequi]MCA6110697.1 DUF2147 domain-containing protein [Bradyrhizobium cenepequi]